MALAQSTNRSFAEIASPEKFIMGLNQSRTEKVKKQRENDDQMGKNGSDFHAALPPLGSQIQMQSEMVLAGL